MLGFDAIGVLPLGSGPRISSNDYVLVADAGSYAITGSVPSLDPLGAGGYTIDGLPIDFIASLASETGKYVITGYEAGYTLIRDARYPRPFDQDQWNASQVQAKPLSIWTDASQSLESWTPKGPSQ